MYKKTRRFKTPGNTIISREIGHDCPNCGRPMQVREHKQITEKLRRKPYYYSKWFNCINPKCRTTIVHYDKFKVYNQTPGQEAKRDLLPAQQLRLANVLEQLGETPPWDD